MARYHLRNDGLPGECKATKGNCPLGDADSHFDNKVDALAAAEEKLREEHDYLSSSKKNQVFHVGANGAAEECKFRDGYCEVKPYGHMANVHSSDKGVIKGAAVGLRAAQAEAVEKFRASEQDRRSPPTARPAPARKQPAPSSTSIADDPLTRAARGAIRGTYGIGDQDKLNRGWTPEEIQKNRDDCGHWVPERFRPRPGRGSSC